MPEKSKDFNSKTNSNFFLFPKEHGRNRLDIARDMDRFAFGTVFNENRRKKGNFAGQFRATNGL